MKALVRKTAGSGAYVNEYYMLWVFSMAHIALPILLKWDKGHIMKKAGNY